MSWRKWGIVRIEDLKFYKKSKKFFTYLGAGLAADSENHRAGLSYNSPQSWFVIPVQSEDWINAVEE